MNTNDTDTLSRLLADVPPLPETIFPAVIEQRARQRRTRRWLYAVAATVVLGVSAGMWDIAHLPHSAAQASGVATTMDDVDSTLSEISDYLNGSDIESELAQYALAESDSY